IERRIRPRDEHAHVIELFAAKIVAHEIVGLEEMLAVLDERDHAHGWGREAAEPCAERLLVGTERHLLHPRDEALVVLAHAIELPRGRRHRVDELEDRWPLALVEDARDVRMPRQAL